MEFSSLINELFPSFSLLLLFSTNQFRNHHETMQYSKIISILIVSVGLASAAVGTSKSDSKNNNNNNSNRKNNNNNNASNVTVTTTTTTRHHNGAVVEDMSVFGSLAALAAGVLLM